MRQRGLGLGLVAAVALVLSAVGPVAADPVVVGSPITVGDAPFGVAVSPDGSRAYVTNYGSGTVSVINTANNTVGSPITVGSFPVGVAVSPDGSRAYVTNLGSGHGVGDQHGDQHGVGSPITVGDCPTGVAVSPDGSRAYVANYGSDTVSVINTATNTRRFPDHRRDLPGWGGGVPGWVPRLRHQPRLRHGVGDQHGDQHGGRFPDPRRGPPVGVAVSPDGSRAYVTNYGSGTVSVINTGNNTVGSTITVGTQPFGVAVSPDGSRAYVTNYGSGSVSVINTATDTVVGSPITVGNGPWGVAVSPDGSRAYVTNHGSGSVSVIAIQPSAAGVGDRRLRVMVRRWWGGWLRCSLVGSRSPGTRPPQPLVGRAAPRLVPRPARSPG